MKKVKYAFAAVAILTAAVTMSFTTMNNQSNSADPGDDCWSSIQLHQDNEQPDVNQELECTGDQNICCVKPNPEAPSGYDQFGFSRP